MMKEGNTCNDFLFPLSFSPHFRVEEGANVDKAGISFSRKKVRRHPKPLLDFLKDLLQGCRIGRWSVGIQLGNMKENSACIRAGLADWAFPNHPFP